MLVHVKSLPNTSGHVHTRYYVMPTQIMYFEICMRTVNGWPRWGQTSFPHEISVVAPSTVAGGRLVHAGAW